MIIESVEMFISQSRYYVKLCLIIFFLNKRLHFTIWNTYNLDYKGNNYSTSSYRNDYYFVKTNFICSSMMFWRKSWIQISDAYKFDN